MFRESKGTLAIHVNQFFFSGRPDNSKEEKQDYWVFVDKIIALKPIDAGLEKYTEILMTNGSLFVQESVEDLLKIIKGEE